MAAAGPLVDAARIVLATDPGEWPEDVELYQPNKVNMLLTDCASCRSVEAYLRFCGLSYDIKSRANAEFMSPTGTVPFLRVGKELISELSNVISFVQAKGLSASGDLEPRQGAEMKAYMSLIETSLVPAELYILWWNKEYAARSRSQYGSPFPTPINKILGYKKQWVVGRHLRALGWHLKCETEVLEEIKRVFQALSEKLGSRLYFICDRPGALDALVFGHLYSILTRYQSDDSIVSLVKSHKNLEEFVNRILVEYFKT